MTYENLTAYLRACTTFENPLRVTGHPAPDTDAAVSALFEAWRLTQTGSPALPLIQGTLSRETAYLLGDIVFPDLPDGCGKWVLTDHHDTAAYEGEVVAIVDHHPVAEGVTFDGIDACIRPVGAATTLVAQRIRENGFALDPACARILLGAILLDTEGLSSRKAKEEDRDAAAWLSALCGEEVYAFYGVLQEQLLSETDVDVLYERDYRAYTAADGSPLLGFAILKVRRGNLPDRDAVRRRLAEDAAAHGYAATVAKIALYGEDNRREEHYLAAGPAAAQVLTTVLTHSEGPAVRVAADEVFLPIDCYHHGRKRYALWLAEALQQHL